ncbi:MAG: hypothetical protein NT027_10815 [Proteobacteria bacterium]|nr:hypothetical protein [Pseudomonadota bacterium]
MSSTIDCESKEQALASASLKRKMRQREMYKIAYEKAKARQKEYLARPDVIEKNKLRKENLKSQRKKLSQKSKESRNRGNEVLKESLKQSMEELRTHKQAERDQELLKKIKPALTLLQGGKKE